MKFCKISLKKISRDTNDTEEQKLENQEAKPRLFDILSQSLQEGIAHVRGEKALRVTTWQVPEPPPVYDAARIRALRAELGWSQPLFPRVLNVSAKTVQGWEQGLRRPSQASARLFQLIERPELLAELRSSPHRSMASAEEG